MLWTIIDIVRIYNSSEKMATFQLNLYNNTGYQKNKKIQHLINTKQTIYTYVLSYFNWVSECSMNFNKL